MSDLLSNPNNIKYSEEGYHGQRKGGWRVRNSDGSDKTYTNIEWLSSGVIVRTLTADCSDTTPSASSIVGSLSSNNKLQHAFWDFFFYNSSSTYNVTLVGGTGVTIKTNAV